MRLISFALLVLLLTSCNAIELDMPDVAVLQEFIQIFPSLTKAPYYWNASNAEGSCSALWLGLTCDYKASPVYQHLIGIDIQVPGDVGYLPSSLASLGARLTSLYITAGFNDSIPSALANLTALTYLQITASQSVNEAFPMWIANLTNLRYLVLDSLNFRGSTILNLNLSTEIFILALRNLSLTGDFPEYVRRLSKLSTLELTLNEFTGPVPAWIQGDLPVLDSLKLEYNNFTAIPSEIASMVSLSALLLGYNKITQLPPEMFAGAVLPNLRDLRASHNLLNGTMPDFSKLENLASLDLGSNKLTGPLLDFSALTKFVILNVDNNQLSGSLPAMSPSLVSLTVRNNSMSGNLTNVVNLTKLITLNLAHNKFSGRVPNLAPLASLRNLYLNDNELSGDINVSLQGVNVDFCDVSENVELVCPVNFTICCDKPPATISSTTTATTTATTMATTTTTTTATTMATTSTTTATSSGCSGRGCQCSSDLTAISSSTFCDAGTWRIEGNVTNNKTVVVGPQDTVLVGGSFVQSSQAILQIYTNGSNGGSVQAEGEVQLGGTLQIVVTSPKAGSSSVVIIQGSAISGQFQEIDITQDFGDSKCYTTKATPQYSATSMSALLKTTKKASCNKRAKVIGIAVGASLGFILILVIAAVIAVVIYQKTKSPGKIMVRPGSTPQQSLL